MAAQQGLKRSLSPQPCLKTYSIERALVDRPDVVIPLQPRAGVVTFKKSDAVDVLRCHPSGQLVKQIGANGGPKEIVLLHVQDQVRWTGFEGSRQTLAPRRVTLAQHSRHLRRSNIDSGPRELLKLGIEHDRIGTIGPVAREEREEWRPAVAVAVGAVDENSKGGAH